MAGAAGAVMARTRPSVTPTFLRRVCDLPRVLPVHWPVLRAVGAVGAVRRATLHGVANGGHARSAT